MIKKLEYLISDLLTQHIKETYPLYVEFLELFARYLDEHNHGKILDIEDNLDSYTTFTELLDLYLNELLPNCFDSDVIDLNDEDKKRFIDLSRRINSLKGNPQSYILFFQILTDFIIAQDSGNINYSNISQIVIADETAAEDICQYYFNTTTAEQQEAIEALIENVHPIGIGYNIITGAIYDGTYDYDGTITY